MTFLLALCAVMLMAADAFSIQCPSRHSSAVLTPIPSRVTAAAPPMTFSTTVLGMSEEASAETENDDGDEAEEEDASPSEDPDVKALKEEIAKLEAQLAEEKSKLEAALDECEEYSKTGYARKVADMENMKRVRSVSVHHGCGLISAFERQTVVVLDFSLVSSLSVFVLPFACRTLLVLEHCFNQSIQCHRFRLKKLHACLRHTQQPATKVRRRRIWI